MADSRLGAILGRDSRRSLVVIVNLTNWADECYFAMAYYSSSVAHLLALGQHSRREKSGGHGHTNSLCTSLNSIARGRRGIAGSVSLLAVGNKMEPRQRVRWRSSSRRVSITAEVDQLHNAHCMCEARRSGHPKNVCEEEPCKSFVGVHWWRL